MFENGSIVGYCVTILRHLPDSPEGSVDYINLRAIATLREEGVGVLSLGVSPFYDLPRLASVEGRGNLAAYLAFHMLYRWGNPMYHFRGLSFHKSRYRARTEPVFAVTRGPVPLLGLCACARATRMV
jgi:phosphatidylglycerol lysyltransferase